MLWICHASALPTPQSGQRKARQGCPEARWSRGSWSHTNSKPRHHQGRKPSAGLERLSSRAAPPEPTGTVPVCLGKGSAMVSNGGPHMMPVTSFPGPQPHSPPAWLQTFLFLPTPRCDALQESMATVWQSWVSPSSLPGPSAHRVTPDHACGWETQTP